VPVIEGEAELVTERLLLRETDPVIEDEGVFVSTSELEIDGVVDNDGVFEPEGEVDAEKDCVADSVGVAEAERKLETDIEGVFVLVVVKEVEGV